MRFTSRTPQFFPSMAWASFFNADSPSGYGYWPFARAAAATGGAYVFYPFSSRKWLDVCPRDDSLVDAMAPELVPVPMLATKLRADPAVRALARATAIVQDATPWTDHSRGIGQGGARGGGGRSWIVDHACKQRGRGRDEPGRSA